MTLRLFQMIFISLTFNKRRVIMDKIKVRLLFVLLVPIFSYGGIYEPTPHETQNQISEPPFLSVCDRTPQVRDKIMGNSQ